jgi:hypothetical protein
MGERIENYVEKQRYPNFQAGLFMFHVILLTVPILEHRVEPGYNYNGLKQYFIHIVIYSAVPINSPLLTITTRSSVTATLLYKVKKHSVPFVTL